MSGRRARAALGEAFQVVVRERLPRRGVRDELPVGRADAGVAVERAEPDADHLVILWMSAPERGAAVRAEELGKATPAGIERGDGILSLRDMQRPRHDAGRARCGGARPALAAGAVAVTRRDERPVHLEPNFPAHAAAAQNAHVRALVTPSDWSLRRRREPRRDASARPGTHRRYRRSPRSAGPRARGRRRSRRGPPGRARTPRAVPGAARSNEGDRTRRRAPGARPR